MAEITDEKYEELRQILEKQNGRVYSSEEVKEIGDGLIDFFNTLLEIETDVPHQTE